MSPTAMASCAIGRADHGIDVSDVLGCEDTATCGGRGLRNVLHGSTATEVQIPEGFIPSPYDGHPIMPFEGIQTKDPVE